MKTLLLAISTTVFIASLGDGPAAAQVVGKPIALPVAPTACIFPPNSATYLGYTQAMCGKCSNLAWAYGVPAHPNGICVQKGVATAPVPAPTPVAACTPTHWGGATLPLRAPNFSTTGAPISVCRNGYDLARSQLTCSSGIAVRAPNAPNTNVTCSGATGAGANPSITMGGTACCL